MLRYSKNYKKALATYESNMKLVYHMIQENGIPTQSYYIDTE